MSTKIVNTLLWWTGGLLAAGLLAGVVLFLAFDDRFFPEAPRIHYPAPASPLAAQRQDLDYYRRLIALDRAFSADARVRADARLASLADSAAVLDADHLRVALLEIAALADNGQTALQPDPSRHGRPRRLPIRVSPFRDGIYVLQTAPADADLLGARVVAVEDLPVDRVIARLEALQGGTAGFRRRYAVRMLNAAGYLHGLDIAASTQRSTWTFQRRDGSTTRRTFEAYQPAAGAPQPSLWRVRSPEPIPGDRPWRAFRPAAPLAVTYRSPDRAFREVGVPHTCVRLVQLKANDDTGRERIEPFLRRAEADLRAARPCGIVLDLRQDGGGGYTTTAAFTAALPSLVPPDGDVYVLIGPGTFAAGITTAVLTRQADPARVKLIGEPVGDRMAFWSQGGSGCLPHAPFCFHFSTARYDYGHPCTDWRTCFWPNWLHPARTDSLAPEELIETSFAAYSIGHDPALDRSLELIDGDTGER